MIYTVLILEHLICSYPYLYGEMICWAFKVISCSWWKIITCRKRTYSAVIVCPTDAGYFTTFIVWLCLITGLDGLLDWITRLTFELNLLILLQPVELSLFKLNDCKKSFSEVNRTTWVHVTLKKAWEVTVNKVASYTVVQLKASRLVKLYFLLLSVWSCLCGMPAPLFFFVLLLPMAVHNHEVGRLHDKVGGVASP